MRRKCFDKSFNFTLEFFHEQRVFLIILQNLQCFDLIGKLFYGFFFGIFLTGKDIKPEIIGNRELQEKAIRHERRIELFAEGQRYFDVRRWMCAEEEGYKQGGPVHGMDMNATDLEGFMKRTAFETRIFEKRMYLYPIPLAEIQKSKKLVQNPGW